jgi:predicted transcriptional regulator
MAAVLKAVGTPAHDSAEVDAQFDADAMAAWETYQLEGTHLTSNEINAVFDEAVHKARNVASESCK